MGFDSTPDPDSPLRKAGQGFPAPPRAAGSAAGAALPTCTDRLRWRTGSTSIGKFGAAITLAFCRKVPRLPAEFLVVLAVFLVPLLFAICSGNAAAQHTQLPTWDGEVEVSETSLTVAPGETVYYSVKLSEAPSVDGILIEDEDWHVFVHVNGVAQRERVDGTYDDLRFVPGFYRTFDHTDWASWKDFRIYRLTDEEWEAEGGGPRATTISLDHEVWDHTSNCPVHDSGPLTVNLGDGNGNEGNGNEGSGNEDSGNEGNGNEGSGNEGSGNEGNGNEGSGNEGSENEGSENEGNDNNGGNSGQSVPDVEGQSRAWANRAILPEMGRTLAFSAARCRIEQMFSDIARGWSKPSTAQLLPPAFAGRGAQRARTLGLKRAFGNASYLLPLAGGDGRGARFAAWACSDYRRLDGSDKGGTALWDGDVFSMQFGAETRLRSNMLAGVALSRAESDIDYTIAGEDGVGGTYDLRMTGVHPYFGLKPSSQLEIWGTAGFGKGTLQVSNSAGARYSGDAQLASGAFGVNSRVLERGSTTLTVKGEFGLANLDVSSASRTFAKAAADLQRFRLAAEIDHEKTVPYVGTLAPWGEVGLRHDSGDGKAGASLELGGGLHYRNVEQGWNSEVFGRWLAARGSGRPKELGFGFRFRYDPGAPGFGPWASLAQGWGPTGSGVQRLWEDRQANSSRSDISARHLELELAYGFRAFRSRGALTPFVRLGLDRSNGRVYRLGTRLNLGPSAVLSLEAARQERSGRDDIHAIILQAALRF